jgi:hypothetical protein
VGFIELETDGAEVGTAEHPMCFGRRNVRCPEKFLKTRFKMAEAVEALVTNKVRSSKMPLTR